MSEILAVLDFGSQYTQVIARRVREAHVYSKITHLDTPRPPLRSGWSQGYHSFGLDPPACSLRMPRFRTRKSFDLGLPVLGICYGLQVMGRLLGGAVEKSSNANYGLWNPHPFGKQSLFEGLPAAPESGTPTETGSTHFRPAFIRWRYRECTFAAVENSDRGSTVCSFHPEVVHTENGTQDHPQFPIRNL